MLGLILNSKIVRQGLAIFAAVVAFLAWLASQKRKAVKADRAERKAKDVEHAKDIRRRVDDVPPVGKLRDNDKRGYRD